MSVVVKCDRGEVWGRRPRQGIDSRSRRLRLVVVKTCFSPNSLMDIHSLNLIFHFLAYGHQRVWYKGRKCEATGRAEAVFGVGRAVEGGSSLWLTARPWKYFVTLKHVLLYVFYFEILNVIL